MSDKNPRYIKIDDWYFEIKTVRALKVDKYGDPYTAIANCHINGDAMYIDGLLTSNNEELSKQDFKSFYKFSQKLDLDSVNYHRYQAGNSVNKKVQINKSDEVNNKSDQDDSLIQLAK